LWFFGSFLFINFFAINCGTGIAFTVTFTILVCTACYPRWSNIFILLFFFIINCNYIKIKNILLTLGFFPSSTILQNCISLKSSR
jgi:hypothetical protein